MDETLDGKGRKLRERGLFLRISSYEAVHDYGKLTAKPLGISSEGF